MKEATLSGSLSGSAVSREFYHEEHEGHEEKSKVLTMEITEHTEKSKID